MYFKYPKVYFFSLYLHFKLIYSKYFTLILYITTGKNHPFVSHCGVKINSSLTGNKFIDLNEKKNSLL
jgi:hypothetical protein